MLSQSSDGTKGKIQGELAEAVGFEPTVGFHPRSVSNRVLSASQPRFRRVLFNGAGQAGQEGKDGAVCKNPCVVARLAQDGRTIAVAGVAMQQGLMDWLRKPYGLVTSCALCTGIVVGTIDDLRHWAIAKASAVFQTAVTAQQACVDQYLDSRPETTEGPYLIIMTDLVNDEDQTQTRSLDQNLRTLYGQDVDGAIQLEAVPCTIYPTAGNAADRYEGAKQTALDIATWTKADVVIWGEVVGSGLKINLSMTHPRDSANREYMVQDNTLDANFGEDIGALIAVKMLTLAEMKPQDHGTYVVPRMTRVITLTAPLVNALPDQMSAYDRCRLFLSFGLALQIVGLQSGDADMLKKAVAALQTALDLYPDDAPAYDWAFTQNALGVALVQLAEREGGIELLEAAAAAFKLALIVRTKADEPADWATTKNNLGNVLARLAEHQNSADLFQDAVTAYSEALTELSQSKQPLDWARTQNNLGNALTSLAELQDSPDLLHKAIAAHTEALKERRRDLVPLDWANSQSNLGIALRALGKRQEGTAAFDQARLAYTSALQERRRDLVPLDWAMTTYNLALLDVSYFQKTHQTAWLNTAREQTMQARAVFEEIGATVYVAAADGLLSSIETAAAP